MSLLEESPMEAQLRHLLGKALDAHRGGYASWRGQSTGEKLAVALVLDKPEWIAEMGYTLAEAIDRVDAPWVGLLLTAQRLVDSHGAELPQ